MTLVGITISGIERDSGQLTLPLSAATRAALDATLDEVRERFGTAAITRATLLGSDRPAAWRRSSSPGSPAQRRAQPVAPAPAACRA